MYYLYQAVRLGLPSAALIGMFVFVLPEGLRQLFVWIFLATATISVVAGLVPWQPTRKGSAKQPRAQPLRVRVGVTIIALVIISIVLLGGILLDAARLAIVVATCAFYALVLWIVAMRPVNRPDSD